MSVEKRGREEVARGQNLEPQGRAAARTATLGYADADAVEPTLGRVGVPERADDRALLRRRVALAARLPAAVSVGAHVVFAVAYWIPETSAFPGHDWWLTQLSPLVAETTTSAGRRQVAAQSRQVGVGAELALLASLALPVLVRRSDRLGPALALIPAAVGLVVALGTLLGLLLTGTLGASLLGMLLLGVWVVAAGYAGLHTLLVSPGALPPRLLRQGLPLLGLYLVLGPLPTAVGRALFGGGLRDAAATLVHNTAGLRLAALVTPTTLLLYLAGGAVGLVVWALYQCRPPFTGLGRRLPLLVAALLLAAVLGGLARAEAQHRAQQLLWQAPPAGGAFGCFAATTRPAQPGVVAARSVTVSGLGCDTLTVREGYRQLASHRLDVDLTPVKVDGIGGKVVGATYGDVLVVAVSERADRRADRVVGLGVTDGLVRWQQACGDDQALTVRFSGVSGGDDADRGWVTRASERRPQVVVPCPGRRLRLDPETGRPLT